MDDEDPAYESGPFCMHWSDPSDCTEKCTCGHDCRDHHYGMDCKWCDCENFKEPA